MKTTIIQSDIIWADPEANIGKISRAIAGNKESARTDLFVLPEMFSTGFATEPEGIAETLDRNSSCLSLEWMKGTAREYDCAVAGSIAIFDKEASKYYNRFYFVRPDGKVSFYDKHHLFSYGGEDRHFTQGKERVVVSWRGVNILLQICYDLRFPIFSRNRLSSDGNPEFDMILYVANWPVSRVEAWKTLLMARAIENQCYAVGVNRVGKDPSCTYPGTSAIIDPYGNIIAGCKSVRTPEENGEDMASAEIDLHKLSDFRSVFPVLKDTDSEPKNNLK